ncbi:hypothetical protein Pyn_37559 [Prunus yedoensis var. nudiflora]|uniref:Uncharacterized protein n=1 Tax=Prunus yedoensis var. nudiflora TaxID=2094558 RepID=A0A314YRE2_PRUYE|nr:hypothetical protein Pyn_37559 [Prunus yedoensis var. nudiflora]
MAPWETSGWAFSCSKTGTGQSIKIHLFAALPVQAFMLKRAAEEPLGHAAAIITMFLRMPRPIM